MHRAKKVMNGTVEQCSFKLPLVKAVLILIVSTDDETCSKSSHAVPFRCLTKSMGDSPRIALIQ